MSCVPVASLCRSAKLPARIGATFLTLCLIAGPILAHAAEGGAAAPAPAAPAATPQAPAPAPDAAAAPARVTLPIVYLGKQYDEPLPLSYAEEIITDKGIQGARVSIKEANQAGNFVGNAFELVEAIVPADGDVVAKAKEVLKNGDALIVADLEAPDLIAVADLPEAKNSVIMNIRSNDVALRQEECRQNVFHIIPDWAMRADAIAQYLIWKRWPRWAIIRGDLPADKDFVAQIQRSAKRYGGKIVDERVYTFPPGARNLDSAISRCKPRSPWRPKARRETTRSGSPTPTKASATIFSTAPIRRASSSARKAFRRLPGTSPIPNPAPCICRTLCRGWPSARPPSATTPPGSACARSPTPPCARARPRRRS